MTSAIFGPQYMVDAQAHYARLKARHGKRDHNHNLIHQVRKGNMRQLFPAELEFSITFDGVPIANFIDVVARDMSEAIAPLPSLACTSGKMKTDADQNRARVKNRIGDWYWTCSKLESQMIRGADRYVSYGFVPFYVEPDTDNQMPFIRVENPRHAYYELDRFGNPTVYAKRWLKSVDDLCSMFPHLAAQIIYDPQTKTSTKGETTLEMVRWVDKKYVTIFLPDRGGLVLARYEHRLNRLPVWIAERPSDEDEGENVRGQFDDVIWVQVARAIMSTLALEAASLAVQAPIAVPTDMDEFNVGPHAILQSDDSDKIHRVAVDVPPTIFAENQTLDQELKMGARYPDARTGGVQASVITGKGVEALLGTFDTQIKGAQMVLREALQQVTSICFEMDETWWPDVTKTINGTLTGESYEFDYTPRRDINGRYNCTVTYGFAAGMHPAQSIVTMLQLEGAGLIAKGTTMENLPFSIDKVQEQRQINIEGTREALKQGIFSVIQSAGPMALQGQDPMPFLKLAADAVRGLEDGKTVEDAVAEAFANMEQAQQAAAQQAAEQQGAAPGGGAPGPGGENPLGFNGLPQGVAPGQAGLPPGGSPTILQAIAGFRGNASQPVNSAVVRRSTPTGT